MIDLPASSAGVVQNATDGKMFAVFQISMLSTNFEKSGTEETDED